MTVFSALKYKPNLRIVVAVIATTALSGIALAERDLFFNPTLLLRHDRRHEEPYPWNKVKPNENLKLYAVNQRFDNIDPTSIPKREWD
ncbi:hypothetical protein SpCBS45565_g05297 [Spizellomyces sp. 'palustris']|nr:hypothetical protein SpCBS45565_g05297 [Spizellomyces sp. 'palustris']